MISKDYLDRFIDDAIAEDIGPGDHSSNCSIPAEAEGKMKLLVKEEGIIAGIDVAKRVFEKVDPAIKMNVLMKEGDPVPELLENLALTDEQEQLLAEFIKEQRS